MSRGTWSGICITVVPRTRPRVLRLPVMAYDGPCHRDRVNQFEGIMSTTLLSVLVVWPVIHRGLCPPLLVAQWP